MTERIQAVANTKFAVQSGKAAIARIGCPWNAIRISDVFAHGIFRHQSLRDFYRFRRQINDPWNPCTFASDD
jgi:hypothetical protein